MNNTTEIDQLLNSQTLTFLSIKIMIIFLKISINMVVIYLILFRMIQNSYLYTILLSLSASSLINAFSMTLLAVFTIQRSWTFSHDFCVLWIVIDLSSFTISMFQQACNPYKATFINTFKRSFEDLSILRYVITGLVWIIPTSFWSALVIPISSQNLKSKQLFLYGFLICDIFSFSMGLFLPAIITIKFIKVMKNVILNLNSPEKRDATKKKLMTIKMGDKIKFCCEILFVCLWHFGFIILFIIWLWFADPIGRYLPKFAESVGWRSSNSVINAEFKAKSPIQVEKIYWLIHSVLILSQIGNIFILFF
jgi:hypothetical protein